MDYSVWVSFPEVYSVCSYTLVNISSSNLKIYSISRRSILEYKHIEFLHVLPKTHPLGRINLTNDRVLLTPKISLQINLRITRPRSLLMINRTLIEKRTVLLIRTMRLLKTRGQSLSMSHALVSKFTTYKVQSKMVNRLLHNITRLAECLLTIKGRKKARMRRGNQIYASKFQLLAMPNLRLLTILCSNTRISPGLATLNRRLLRIESLACLNRLIRVTVRKSLGVTSTIHKSSVLQSVRRLIRNRHNSGIVKTTTKLSTRRCNTLTLISELRIRLITARRLPSHKIIRSLRTNHTQKRSYHRLLKNTNINLRNTMINRSKILKRKLIIRHILTMNVSSMLHRPVGTITLTNALRSRIRLISTLNTINLNRHRMISSTQGNTIHNVTINLRPGSRRTTSTNMRVLLRISRRLLITTHILAFNIHGRRVSRQISKHSIATISRQIMKNENRSILLITRISSLRLVTIFLRGNNEYTRGLTEQVNRSRITIRLRSLINRRSM